MAGGCGRVTVALPVAAASSDAADRWMLRDPGPVSPPGALPAATLVADLPAVPAEPTVLLHAVPGAGSGLRRLMLRGCSARGVALLAEGAGGAAILRAAWPPGGVVRAGIAVGWTPARLTLATAAGGASDLGQPDAAGPCPFTVDAAAAAVLAGAAPGLWTHPAVAWTALRDGPPAPLPAALIGPATLVSTPAGLRRAEALRPGDAVLTLDRGAQPLARVVRRALPGRGTLAPVRLRAGYCPIRRDILVGPRQAVLLDGPGVEDATGREAVPVRADHLAESRLALRIEAPGPVAMVSLALAEPGLILADGMALACAAHGPVPEGLATRAEAAAILTCYRRRAAGD